MIDNNKNPWIDMASSTRRRVDALAGHSVFWFTDLKGNYGLYVKAGKPFDNLDKSINLKGISMVRKSPEEGSGELFLILELEMRWLLAQKVDLQNYTLKKKLCQFMMLQSNIKKEVQI